MFVETRIVNYHLAGKYNTIKYKEYKGQEPSKTLCGTRISGIVDDTSPFTSVIIKYLKNKTSKV